MKPVEVLIDGQRLSNWETLSLSRSKDEMTGSLSVEIFNGYMPSAPIMVDAVRGREIAVYIGGHIAFLGTLDARNGSGRSDTPAAQRSASIGPDTYSVSISARGKTKGLIDSSHRHPTTNILQPSNRDVVETLLEGFDIDLEWMASTIQLDKVRFRDGARVFDEIFRVGNENAHYIYETRDGKLRVTDDTGRTTGEPLILGENILQFSAEQSEEPARSEIKVKGQRTKRDIRGADAVLDRVKVVRDNWVQNVSPLIIQHYGDGSDEALDRRATFEAEKRASKSKKVTIDVFHVQSRDGTPWDVGTLHYLEIPPEGIFDVFECTGVQYTVQPDQTLKTTLTLSPPPTGGLSGATVPTDIANFATDFLSIGAARRRSAGIELQAGQFPSPWNSADLASIPASGSLFDLGAQVLTNFQDTLPMVLPAGFGDDDQ